MGRKKIIILGIGVFLALFQISCNKVDLIGDWDDKIELSTRLVNLDSPQNIVEVKAQNTWWWINSINIGDKYFFPDYQTNMFDKENITIISDWLIVERKDGETIQLSVTKNMTQEKRAAKITLQAGNYFDYITVIQSNQ